MSNLNAVLSDEVIAQLRSDLGVTDFVNFSDDQMRAVWYDGISMTKLENVLHEKFPEVPTRKHWRTYSVDVKAGVASNLRRMFKGLVSAWSDSELLAIYYDWFNDEPSAADFVELLNQEFELPVQS